MKSKSISFAEVLRKTSKSPRVEPAVTGLTLEELVQRFENDPSEDYTLYLGHFNASQRSKPSASKMAFSRNTVGNQEEVFDSWIQKQSTLGSNKENIRNQPQRLARNEPVKRSEGGFRKTITHSKAKQDAYPINSINSHRQKEINQIEEPQQNFPTLNIEMIKSNGYQNDQAINRCKSPKNEKKLQPIQPPPPISLQYDRPDRSKFNISERTNQIKVEPTFKEIKESKESEKLQSQFGKVSQRFNNLTSLPQEQPNQSMESNNMQEQISEIKNKYMNANYSPECDQADLEDEELLLQNSPPIRTQNSEICFNDTYAKKAQEQDDIMKKRMADAKNMIGNMLVKFQKEKEEQKNEDFYVMNPHYGKNQANNSNHMVGYSFSNNFMGVNQSAQNQPGHQEICIPDVVSEAPDEVDQPLSDSASFKNKYLNLQSFENVEHNEHIQNIQSVKYEGEENNQNLLEEDRHYVVPNDTFKIQLITSKERQNKFSGKYEFNQIKNVPTTFKENFNSLRNIGPVESIHVEIEAKGSKPYGRSKQKISLMSSKSRSNKTSPTAPNKQEKQPEVATTDFTITLAKDQKTPESILPTNTQIKTSLTSNSFKSPQTYQFSSKNEAAESKTWQNYRFSSNTMPRSQNKTLSIVTPEPKAQEPNKYEYFAPTYAKTTSKLADITSDYYSTKNYSQYTPSYQTEVQYETPSYGKQQKNNFASSKNYEQLPLKLQNPYTYELSKQQFKKESSYGLPATNSYQQKYAIPTSYANNADKQVKKNYLSQLEIKQSITIEQSKTKQEYNYNSIKNSNNNIFQGNTAKQFKTVNPIASSRASLKLSLKQSINVAQSEEFIFDL